MVTYSCTSFSLSQNRLLNKWHVEENPLLRINGFFKIDQYSVFSQSFRPEYPLFLRYYSLFRGRPQTFQVDQLVYGILLPSEDIVTWPSSSHWRQWQPWECVCWFWLNLCILRTSYCSIWPDRLSCARSYICWGKLPALLHFSFLPSSAEKGAHKHWYAHSVHIQQICWKHIIVSGYKYCTICDWTDTSNRCVSDHQCG